MSDKHARPFRLVKPLLAAVALGLVALGLVAACGGSSSESPWPVEPEHVVSGPEGEEGKPPPRVTPDAGPDAAPNVEP